MFTNESSTDFDAIFDEGKAPDITEDITPPANILTEAQAAAVRFYARKKGYDFAQVEEFVDRVRSSLAYYEHALDILEKAYNEQSEDLHYKDSQVSQLRATIEVFRAKGDPMVNSAGDYITESQVRESAEYQALQRDNESLRARIDDLQNQLADTATPVEDRSSPTPELRDEEGADEGNMDTKNSTESAYEQMDAPPLPDDKDVSPSNSPAADLASPVQRPVPGLLSFAPEAKGADLSDTPHETPTPPLTRDNPERLNDAPEAQQ